MPEYRNIADNTMINDAIALAVMAHRGQIRKDPSELPYIVHPLHAMQILIDHGITDKRVLAAMVLHDVVEDTNVGIELIRRQFPRIGPPPFVDAMVDALSKDAGNEGTMHEKSAAGHGQTMHYVREFGHTIRHKGMPLNPAILLKQADRLSNLMGAFPKNWDLEKHEQYLEQSKEIWMLDTRTALAHSLDNAIHAYSRHIDELKFEAVDDIQVLDWSEEDEGCMGVLHARGSNWEYKCEFAEVSNSYRADYNVLFTYKGKVYEDLLDYVIDHDTPWRPSMLPGWVKEVTKMIDDGIYDKYQEPNIGDTQPMEPIEDVLPED